MTPHNFIVFGDDWARHPSSSQQLIRKMSDDHSIIWVNSIGMRSPKLRMYDLQRVLQRFRGIASRKPQSATKDISTNPVVINPRFVPFHKHEAVRALNRLSVGQQISQELHKKSGKVIKWVSNPMAGYLHRAVDSDLLIYYCGDDFLAFPDIDRPTLTKLEDQLLAQADISIFSSKHLIDVKGDRARGEKVFLPHGVDLARFEGDTPPMPGKLASIPRPLVGYFGIFSDWIDLEILKQVAQRDPSIHYVLMGEPDERATRLGELANIHLVGKIPYADLPQYARQLDVALLLYKLNDMTAAISPLKMYECFAMGLPVVSTRNFPGLDGGQEIKQSTDPDEFLEHIRNGVKASNKKKEQLKAIAADNTWQNRHETLTKVIESHLV